MKARDLKPGWFFSESDGALQMAVRLSECGHMWSAIAHGSKVLIQLVGGNIEVTHHPDCTGRDWERPKLQPAIDPGDGWRLLEDGDWLEDGDEFINRENVWKPCMFFAGNKVLDAFDRERCRSFRRRIVYIPFTQDTFREHRDKWIVDKDWLLQWYRAERVRPDAVLYGSLWIPWDMLLDKFCFEGGGVCGEVKE